MQLKLICHGMMGFWYRPATANPAHLGYEGYSILIPNVLQDMNGHNMHELILRVGPGTTGLQGLSFLPGGNPPGTKTYKLVMKCKPGAMTAAPDPRNPVVGLYRQNNDFIAPRRDPHDGTIAYALEVPYPHAKAFAGIRRYSEVPFTGAAVGTFNIQSVRIAGMRVFTYELENEDVYLENVADATDKIDINRGPTSSPIKLHLYNQPVHHAGNPGEHLKMIKSSFNYQGQPVPLDLKTGVTSYADFDQGDFTGLVAEDRRDLHELAQSRGPVQQVPVPRSFDPAECLPPDGC